MALFLGTARDVVVKRTIEGNRRERVNGNLFRQTVTVKYEVENFKSESVRLTVIESPKVLRDRLAGNTGRAPEWTLGESTTFPGGADEEKTTNDSITLHAELPAANGGTARKVIHRVELTFHNEWR